MPISTIPGHLIGNSQMIPSAASNLGVAIVENSASITSNYCISTGSNATSAGPLTISDGVTITVPNGSTWSIV
jgi:hypothetical protein